MDVLIDMVLNGSLGEKLIVLVPLLIAVANAVTVFMPSVKDNAIYNMVMKVLNAVALNILKNKNADEDPVT